MSTPNPALTAAAPELKAIIQALDTFVTNLGPDPTKLPATFGPALQILAGTAGLQLPVLANSEWGVVTADAHSTFASWINSLDALIPSTAAAKA